MFLLIYVAIVLKILLRLIGVINVPHLLIVSFVSYQGRAHEVSIEKNHELWIIFCNTQKNPHTQSWSQRCEILWIVPIKNWSYMQYWQAQPQFHSKLRNELVLTPVNPNTYLSIYSTTCWIIHPSNHPSIHTSVHPPANNLDRYEGDQ